MFRLATCRITARHPVNGLPAARRDGNDGHQRFVAVSSRLSGRSSAISPPSVSPTPLEARRGNPRPRVRYRPLDTTAWIARGHSILARRCPALSNVTGRYRDHVALARRSGCTKGPEFGAGACGSIARAKITYQRQAGGVAGWVSSISAVLIKEGPDV
jgi:hypothetical protein